VKAGPFDDLPFSINYVELAMDNSAVAVNFVGIPVLAE